jgi:hypothetical protein
MYVVRLVVHLSSSRDSILNPSRRTSLSSFGSSFCGPLLPFGVYKYVQLY